jgi:hypothetical protein
MTPMEAPAPAGDVTMASMEAHAPTDVTMAPMESPAPTGDVTMAQMEAHAPMRAPTLMDVVMAAAEAPAPAEAPADITMAPAEAPAPMDEISPAQEFPRGRFAAAKLVAAPARRGRPKAPIVCAGCKLVFHSSDAKYNHVRCGKRIPV